VSGAQACNSRLLLLLLLLVLLLLLLLQDVDHCILEFSQHLQL
jgi:hypothetical protein